MPGLEYDLRFESLQHGFQQYRDTVIHQQRGLKPAAVVRREL